MSHHKIHSTNNNTVVPQGIKLPPTIITQPVSSFPFVFSLSLSHCLSRPVFLSSSFATNVMSTLDTGSVGTNSTTSTLNSRRTAARDGRVRLVFSFMGILVGTEPVPVYSAFLVLLESVQIVSLAISPFFAWDEGIMKSIAEWLFYSRSFQATQAWQMLVVTVIAFLLIGGCFFAPMYCLWRLNTGRSLRFWMFRWVSVPPMTTAPMQILFPLFFLSFFDSQVQIQMRLVCLRAIL
jgi:hypothetical protein